jgi:subtilase family serine protease
VARRLLLAASGVIALVAAGLGSATAQAAPAAAPSAAGAKISTHRACAKPARKYAACFALQRTDAAAVRANQAMRAAAPAGVAPNATPRGLGPAQIQNAYALTGINSGGKTVAIVDAYNDPTAESDLAVYRSQYGLPPCTKASGCFKKVSQTGSTTALPRTDAGWAQEISLDLDMVSAACPDCKILLVEAKSASLVNLGTAVNYAARQPGVIAISNSYGGSDLPDSSYGSYYNHPGIAVTASSGDSGYGAQYPASSQYVVAVGGTSLAGSTGSWSETVWSGAGSGCSAYNPALSVAAGVDTGCTKRAEADVAAVADPNTGVAVYDSTPYQGSSGWLVFGGTSASAPIIASVFALAHDIPSGTQANTLPYTERSSANLHDVITGSNGTCPTPQWCRARTGWDGPTGLGTPNGIGAF